MEKETWYREKLDREEMVNHISGLVKAKFSPEQLQEIDDLDLAGRLRKIMTNHSVGGMLDDLTPEEMEIFDAAVERR